MNTVIAIKLSLDNLNNFASTEGQSFKIKLLAEVDTSQAIAILLTGMGTDGAAGMHMIHQAGGLTIAQAQETSVIFGMPKEAIELGGVKHILPLSKITPFLITRLVWLWHDNKR